MTDLSPEECLRLGQFADLLIPKADGALSASEAGIAGWLLDEIATHAPERIALLRQIIGSGDGDPREVLQAVKRADRALYDAFCETIAAAYFMSPEVRQRIGFPGRKPIPARTDPDSFDALLRPVRQAGFAPRSSDNASRASAGANSGHLPPVNPENS